ncbi:hypothetical protein SHIRM173S_08529 [Streptomyces hirsutus]
MGALVPRTEKVLATTAPVLAATGAVASPAPAGHPMPVSPEDGVARPPEVLAHRSTVDAAGAHLGLIGVRPRSTYRPARRSTPPTAHHPDRTLPGSGSTPLPDATRVRRRPGLVAGVSGSPTDHPRITHGDRRVPAQARRRPLGFPFRAGDAQWRSRLRPPRHTRSPPAGHGPRLDAGDLFHGAGTMTEEIRAAPACPRAGGSRSSRGTPRRPPLPLGARRHPPVPVTSYAPSPSPSPRPGRRRNGPCCRRRRPRPGRPGSR